jgi:hypothetical protein
MTESLFPERRLYMILFSPSFLTRNSSPAVIPNSSLIGFGIIKTVVPSFRHHDGFFLLLLLFGTWVFEYPNEDVLGGGEYFAFLGIADINLYQLLQS